MKHNLKNQNISLQCGSITYSRLKVDAHSKCNNEFGSRYEDKVIKILDNLEQYRDDLESMHLGSDILLSPCEGISSLISSWFMKIYYGTIWFQAHLKNSNDIQFKEFQQSLLEDHSFKLMQSAYRMGKGFNLPSSIYYFKLPSIDIMPFEQGYMHDPPTYWMKIHENFFMMSIGDGQLCYNYLDSHIVDQIKINISNNGQNPLIFLDPLSTLISVRKNLPKSPSFVISDNSIMNMSMMTMSAKKFEIDENAVNRGRKEIYSQLIGRFSGKKPN